MNIIYLKPYPWSLRSHSNNTWHSREWMPNLNLMAGQKKFGSYPRAIILCFFTHSRKEAKSTKLWVKRAKLKAFAGHIRPAGRMLCMPARRGWGRQSVMNYLNVPLVKNLTIQEIRQTLTKLLQCSFLLEEDIFYPCLDNISVFFTIYELPFRLYWRFWCNDVLKHYRSFFTFSFIVEKWSRKYFT